MMHALRISLLALDYVVAIAWSWRAAQWLRGMALVPDVARAAFALPDTALVDQAAVSVIVPARDEERAIAACLDSLLASSGVRLEIIAVDDRSTDQTGRIMDAVASRNETAAGAHTLRVIHVESLPAGWTGKAHAMARAAAEASNAWLLFTDGDILFRPDALARVMRYAHAERADHVVLYPTMIFESFGERMMLAFLHAMSMWGIRPWRVGDPDARNDYIGIGAFNLMRRPVYDAAGGWSALRMEVVEDLRMGFILKRGGYRQRAVFGRDLIRVRWAEGVHGVVTGTTKNLFALFRFHIVVATFALFSLVPLCLLPFAGLAMGAAGWGAFLPVMLFLTLLYGRNHGLGLPGALYSFTFPIGSCILIVALARSIAATLLQGGVRWRGTLYSLKELRKHAGPLR